MKTYTINLTVADDFDPSQLDVELSYPDDAGIQDESEGFGFSTVEQAVKSIVVDNIDVSETSVVFFKFPSDIDPGYITAIQKTLESSLGCTVIGLVNDIDLLVQNSAEAVKMLEGMIAKVKSKSIITLV